MEDLFQKGERLLDVIDNALKSGHWKTDGACDPTAAVESFRAELWAAHVQYLIDNATNNSEVLIEREKCASLADDLARAIRTRGEK